MVFYHRAQMKLDNETDKVAETERVGDHFGSLKLLGGIDGKNFATQWKRRFRAEQLVRGTGVSHSFQALGVGASFVSGDESLGMVCSLRLWKQKSNGRVEHCHGLDHMKGAVEFGVRTESSRWALWGVGEVF